MKLKFRFSNFGLATACSEILFHPFSGEERYCGFQIYDSLAGPVTGALRDRAAPTNKNCLVTSEDLVSVLSPSGPHWKTNLKSHQVSCPCRAAHLAIRPASKRRLASFQSCELSDSRHRHRHRQKQCPEILIHTSENMNVTRDACFCFVHLFF